MIMMKVMMVRTMYNINDDNINTIVFCSHQVEELIILLVRNIQCLLKKETYVRIGKFICYYFDRFTQNCDHRVSRKLKSVLVPCV